MRAKGWLVVAGVAALGTMFIGGCGGDGNGGTPTPAPAQNSIGSIKVLSNRADLVSGGDALVEIVPVAGVVVADLRLDIDGADVTVEFAQRGNGRFMGKVTGLKIGTSVLSARLIDGSVSRLSITNYPTSGAILYGPQIQPWGCDTGALNAQCDRPVSYAYKYVSSNPALTGFLAYDPAAPPSDVATTTTDRGAVVPFVVRVETGVQDRDYYDIAVLFDSTKPWKPWQPQAGWNQKLLIVHGSGCGNGYSQSNAFSSTRVMDRYALSKGFAVLAISLNDAGHNCNIAVQAEATMMAKEHLVETYGEIRYAFGYGGSGGALAQQWMANAYPGLYNGIITSQAFADAGSTMNEVEDCALLRSYFGRTATTWAAAQQAAASGHLNTGVCIEWIDFYGFNNNLNPYATNVAALPGTSPTALGGCDVAASAKYNATSNPGGARCTLQDSAVGIFGRRSDGFANRPYSNVGVQYGLVAMKSGAISIDQFVDLNAGIGSHTIDYALQSPRVAADPGAIAAAYRSGWFNQGNGMGSVAMIHLRSLDISGIHHQYRSWAMRARLDRANGGHGNQAIWYAAGTQRESYDVMDAWLLAVEKDLTAKTLELKVVSNRPTLANDRCGAADGTGLTMVQCTGAADGSTRMGAGADIADDVVECQLAPLDRGSYAPVVFSEAQWVRIQTTFPSGVCDFSKPGTGQQPTQFWQTYLSATGTVLYGGVPLPPER